MKLSTDVARLTDVVDGLDRAVQWPETSLSAAFVFGAALDGAADLDRVEVALVVTEAPEVVPWKWRPAAWPVWNHEIERAARIWTAADGRDQSVLEAFASGRLDRAATEKPADTDELLAELIVERDVGRRHLATVTASFHERDWRREHRGGGIHPEDHLWGRPQAFLTLMTPSVDSSVDCARAEGRHETARV